MKRIIVGVIVLGALAMTAARADADAKEARKLNAKGMKLYKKKKFEQAQAVFVKAIAADATMVIPHYNLASVAAINFDTEVVIEQLTWLKGSSDPAAAKRLVKARSDPDFRHAAGHPKVREMIGLPALDAMSADRVLEYGGVWSGTDVGCSAAWYEYRFAKDGTYNGRSYCGDDGVVRKSKGKWSIAGDKLHVAGKNAAVEYAWQPCGSLTGDDSDGSSCLVSDTVELARGPH